jgi:hypothetical protein
MVALPILFVGMGDLSDEHERSVSWENSIVNT